MDVLTSNSLYMMQRSLDYLWSKQTCILDNIANVETPNYQAKYVTFEDTLKQAILDSAAESHTSAAIRQAIQDTPVVIHQAEESTRQDDNGVDITAQAVELSSNAYQMQYVMNSISTDFSTLRTVIRG